MELSRNRSTTQEVFVSHANAALTPIARLRLGQLVVEEGWSISQAAEFYRVSWPTAKRWAERYRRRLDEHPRATARVTRDNWREAIGDYARMADWVSFFERELKEPGSSISRQYSTFINAFARTRTDSASRNSSGAGCASRRLPRGGRRVVPRLRSLLGNR